MQTTGVPIVAGLIFVIVALLVVLPIWIFGGGALLWVGGRFIAKAPKATYWRSVATNVLAVVCGDVVFIALLAAGWLLGRTGAVLGGIVGLAAGLIVVWVIIKAMFQTSFGRAILAWLPTLAPAVLAAPFAIAAAWVTPPVSRAQGVAKQSLCRNNLRTIGMSLLMYSKDYNGQLPADLKPVAPYWGGTWGDQHTEKLLHCPASDGQRQCDYFVLLGPQPERLFDIDSPSECILACEFRDNHGGKGRNVIFVDCHAAWMSEKEFQAELAKPQNAAFAEALRAAEGP